MRVLLDELARNFRTADFFDILLITLFIYTALIWFQRTASRSVVVGLGVVTFIYFLARKFDLYLTSLVFQMLLAVLVVALVVVFQEEIRRTFERIAAWGSFRERRRFAAQPGVDPLVEAVADLATDHVGALIVIRGREPLDRHVEGGIPLYGRVSKPLLHSIFDPHSAGHDGAVLVEGDRVTRFAVHLPLSRNLAQIGMAGTRHAAALGVSEQCDCFVIVVSEERGTIGVAEEGRLETIRSVVELKGRLDRFTLARFPRVTDEPEWARLFRQNARIKIFSLVLAVAAWFLFAYRAETIQRTFAIPIEYRNLQSGWILEGQKPAEARVTLSGSERAFNLLNPSNLILSLDLSRMQEGIQRFVIAEEDLKKPAGLHVYRIDPDVITLRAYPMVTVSLPIEVQTVGEPPPSVRLVGVKVLPATVRVRVRKGHLEQVSKLYTEPVDVREITQTTLLTTELLLPDTVRPSETPLPEIRVTVEVAPAG